MTAGVVIVGAEIGRASCRERVEGSVSGGAEDGIRDGHVTGVQTCALPISLARLEAKVALETLLPRLGDYEIAGDYVWGQRVNFRGLLKLPLAWALGR